MQDRRSRGFTLVELMLAMTFISMLLVAIAVSTIQIMHTYNRGLTVKAINQAGRDVGDRLKRDSLVTTLPNNYLVEPDNNNGNLGRLCLGSYSYLWAEANSLRSGNGPKYSDTGEPIILARVPDRGAAYCQPDESGTYSRDVAKRQNGREVANELLQSVKNDLAVRNISVQPIGSEVNSHQLYAITYILGTNEQDTIDTASQTCLPPAEMGSNYDFCAVNQFEIIVSVG